MSGLDLAKRVGLKLGECKNDSKQVEWSVWKLEEKLRGKISDGIFVAWQIQSIIWGKFDGEKFASTEPFDVDDWLECRIFNTDEEIHLKRSGEKFVGRYVQDAEGTGNFYVDSFSRLWGERKNSVDGWITLRDDSRKISVTIPCDDGDKKFYGLLTRNYIGSDAATGLSGYVDCRFVAIELAWDGD